MPVFNFTRANNGEDCQQGATFEREIVLRDENNDVIPLAGYSASMQIRTSPASTAVTATVTSVIASDTITISLTAAQTAAIPAWNYYYDLELANGSGGVDRLIEGRFEVTAEVTRT
jgi:flavoprotein